MCLIQTCARRFQSYTNDALLLNALSEGTSTFSNKPYIDAANRRMKQKLHLTHLLLTAALYGLLRGVTSSAAPIDLNQARTAATTFLTLRYPVAVNAAASAQFSTGVSEFSVKDVEALVEKSGATNAFIARLNPAGYVILRADDQVPPVKFYSEHGSFTALPPTFLKVLILELGEELNSLHNQNTQNVASAGKYFSQWQSLLNPAVQLQSASLAPSSAGTTLLTTTWNQNDPYNYFCPAASGGPGGRAWAGCSAVAFSQILRYWQKPVQIVMDYSYTDNQGSCTGTHSASDAGLGSYNWAAMPNSIGTGSPADQKQAVGQLMYHCAVTLNANFEANETGAGTDELPTVLSNYFAFASGRCESKSVYGSVDWYNKISADIDVARPIQYSMWVADLSSGHAVVCDGYRNGNEIHLNLGWSGSWDGWYNLDTVVASGYTWTCHKATFGIKPLGVPSITAQPASQTIGPGMSAMFNVAAMGLPSLNYQWQKNGANIGGATGQCFNLVNVQTNDSGNYSAVVTNGLGSATSQVAVLTVQDPYISTQPVDQTVLAGQTGMFSVVAIGAPLLKYQWQKSGSNLVWATNSQCVITNCQDSDVGDYAVMVSNGSGTRTSSVAHLYMNIDALNPAANNSVMSVALQADGKILVGGQFSMLGGQSRSRIGRLNVDGSVDTGFNPGANNTVYSIALLGDGKILVCGAFTTLGGQSRNRIGRLNADGSVDAGFNPGANDIVNSIAVQSDGKVLVAGNFTTLGGQSRAFIGRINVDGSVDTSFNPGANFTICTLALQADGKILAGGGFTTLGGQPRNNIGRLNADGSLDAGFNPGANNSVYSMAIQPDGKILVGGQFSTLGGQSRSCIGRLNVDGSVDASFNLGTNGFINSTALQTDGKILVGGRFSTLGGLPRSNFGRLCADGSVDTGFNPGANDFAWAIAIQSDGNIVVGGQFTSFGSQARSRIARCIASGLATQSLTFDSGTIRWLRGGNSPEVWRTTFEASTNSSNWFNLGNGISVVGGWQLNGVSLPVRSTIRARGWAVNSGYYGSSGWFVETGIGAPILNSHPSSQTNNAGAKIELSVCAMGTEPLTYQWWRNGVDLSEGGNVSGVHASKLVIPCVVAGDEGNYYVVVTNTYGSVTSQVAFLTVLPPPAITVVSGAHGAVTPSGTVPVFLGGGTNFLITAEPCYHIASVKTNGMHILGSPFTGKGMASTNYVWTNVLADSTLTVDFAVNQYTVTVNSAYGGVWPGTVVTDAWTAVTQYITNSPVADGVCTQYICVGAVITGNAVSASSPTNATLSVTNDCMLTWQWQTQFRLATVTNGNGGIAGVQDWYAKGSNAVVTAVPAAHWHHTGWSGETNGCGIISNAIIVPMTQPRAITANFAIDEYSVTVFGQNGCMHVDSETNWLGYGTELTFFVTNSPLYQGLNATQYICIGWDGTGSVYPNPMGGSNAGPFVLTNDSSLTWLWQTNYWLHAEAGPNGRVSASNGWCAAGAPVLISATAADYYHFAQWTGSVIAVDNPMQFTMDQAHSLIALFAENRVTNGIPEWWLVLHGWTNDFDSVALGDQDQDGMYTWQEWIAGCDPTDSNSVFRFLSAEIGASQGVILRWPSISNRFYNLSRSTNLLNSFITLPGASNMPATPNVNSYTDSVDVVGPRFYRITVNE